MLPRLRSRPSAEAFTITIATTGSILLGAGLVKASSLCADSPIGSALVVAGLALAALPAVIVVHEQLRRP
jgi:hypothetical protein